jgi:hypothetical protein
VLIKHPAHGNVCMFPNNTNDSIVSRATPRNVIGKRGSHLQFILVIRTYPRAYGFNSRRWTSGECTPAVIPVAVKPD